MKNSSNPRYTQRQGQFLAYIHQYGVLNGRAPAEADMERFFRITPPSVHSMVLMLEKKGFYFTGAGGGAEYSGAGAGGGVAGIEQGVVRRGPIGPIGRMGLIGPGGLGS